MTVSTERNQLLDWLDGYILTQLIFTVCEFRSRDLIADGAKTPQELAAATQSDPQSLYRVLRMLAMFGIFFEQADGKFNQTSLSQLLRTTHPATIHPFASTYGQPWWWSSVGRLVDTVKSGKTGFEIEHGMPFFEYLASHPEAAEIFNTNMRASTGVAMEAILEAYQFPNQGILVDIGGGHGGLSEAVLEVKTEMQRVIYDLPPVIETAVARLADSPIRDRIELIGGDFFASIPPGGHLYCLKDILHDWDDADSLRILTNCRQAMPTRSKLLVIERDIPDLNLPSLGKKIDILMLLLTGGQERSPLEYESLLNQAGFKISRIATTELQTNIIEAIPS